MDAIIPPVKISHHAHLPGIVAEQARMMEALALEHGGGAFRWASAPEERSKLWKARHNAWYAALSLRPGCMGFSTDACVPISRLADCILETREDVVSSGLVCPIVGHVGDGNFHVLVLYDPKDTAERERAEALAQRVSLRAIGMGGTAPASTGSASTSSTPWSPSTARLRWT